MDFRVNCTVTFFFIPLPLQSEKGAAVATTVLLGDRVSDL